MERGQGNKREEKREKQEIGEERGQRIKEERRGKEIGVDTEGRNAMASQVPEMLTDARS